MKFQTELNDEMFDVICQYQSLDRKGRNAVKAVLNAEFQRLVEEEKLKEFDEEEFEKELQICKEEIGIEWQ